MKTVTPSPGESNNTGCCSENGEVRRASHTLMIMNKASLVMASSRAERHVRSSHHRSSPSNEIGIGPLRLVEMNPVEIIENAVALIPLDRYFRFRRRPAGH